MLFRSPWQRITGGSSGLAQIRAGGAFLYPFVGEDAQVIPTPMRIGADADHLVVHATIDRVALERALGPRYQAVIEIRLRARADQLHMAPRDSPDGRAGIWLLGHPPTHIVSPAGVHIGGPGWQLDASGPLLIGWALRGDPHDPATTWLQALAVLHAVEGTVEEGRKLRMPFAEMYPGEPAAPSFDLELRMTPASTAGARH